MKKHYVLFLILFSVSINYAQQSAETLVADKAWLYESEEWSDYTYEGKIIFSINNNEEGSLSIGNYDFLFDFCEGKAKFTNKATYSVAEFTHPIKLSSQTDKKGVLNSTYEGVLIFDSGKDYYSLNTVITLLAKGGNILGLKMHIKDNKRKEYAFSLKPSS